MLYSGSNIGVYYKNKEWAKKWFDDFLKEYKSCVSQIRKSNSGLFMLVLNDGTRIKSVQASDSSRGQCFDKAFVEPCIEQRIIDTVICPTVKSQRIIIEGDYSTNG